MMALIFMAVYFAIRMLENAEAALEREFDRSDGLLLNLMPTSMASRLKNNPSEIIADHFDEVTILFADIVGFTPRASQLPPNEVVQYLNRVFSQFDRLAEKYQLEKIKTMVTLTRLPEVCPTRKLATRPRLPTWRWKF
jgi:adenylate cyclase